MILEAIARGECPDDVRAICNIVLSCYDNDIEKARDNGLSNEMVRQISLRTGIGASDIRYIFNKVREQLIYCCSSAEARRLEPECGGIARIFFGHLCALSSLDHIELQKEIRILKSRTGISRLDRISPLLAEVLEEAENSENTVYPGRRVDCSAMFITKASTRLIRLMAIDEVLCLAASRGIGYSREQLQLEVDGVLRRRFGNRLDEGDGKLVNNDFVVLRAMFATDLPDLPAGRKVYLNPEE